MNISIKKPGAFTTIQDQGRFMMGHLGVPVAGYMDKLSAHLANKMVGNDINQGLLEITWTGIEFMVDVSCSIALAGAEFECKVNDQEVNTDQVIILQKGDCFKMGQLHQGVRAYLAVAGGFATDAVAGSQSTLTLAKLGGFKGRCLQAGDQLSLKNPHVVAVHSKPTWRKIKTPSILVVRARPGPEVGVFNPEIIRQAYGQAYQLSKDSNRQGFRLNSATIQYPEGFHMQSSGLIPGSLQVTPDGQTILAMHDAQTTGGYPRILVINQNELHKLAQARPEQSIYFFVEV